MLFPVDKLTIHYQYCLKLFKYSIMSSYTFRLSSEYNLKCFSLGTSIQWTWKKLQVHTFNNFLFTFITIKFTLLMQELHVTSVFSFHPFSLVNSGILRLSIFYPLWLSTYSHGCFVYFTAARVNLRLQSFISFRCLILWIM